MKGFTWSQWLQMRFRELTRAYTNSAARRSADWLAMHHRPPSDSKPAAVFDFSDSRIDGPQGRRIYTLIVYCMRAGYDVNLVLRPRFAFNLHQKLKGLILNQPVRFLHPFEDFPTTHILFTDWRLGRKRAPGCYKCVEIDYGPYRSGANDAIPLPFPMHPWVYRNDQDTNLGLLRSRERKIRLFFMGDVAPKYSSHEVNSRYGMIPRDEMIRILSEGLPKDRVWHLRSSEEWQDALESGFDGFAWASVNDFRIVSEDWLQAIASADSFLCCPGVRYPMSHNAIECMAVGSIPLIEYGNHFHPSLDDSCALRFSGESGLLEAAQSLLSMSDSDLAQKRRAATARYDAQLTPAALLERIRAWEGDHLKLYVHAHQYSDTGANPVDAPKSRSL